MVPVDPLPDSSLYRRCDPRQFSFESTAELQDLAEIVGQERALEAIRFGIGIQHEGFNLFILGPNGTGKFTAVNQFLMRRAVNEPTPEDWCYVYNFEQPHKPTAIRMPSGSASDFSNRMKKLLADLRTLIPAAFTSDEYLAQKKVVEAKVEEQQTQALDDLRKQAEAAEIALIRTPSGFAFAPVKEGNVISPEEFRKLTDDEQRQIEEEVAALQESLQGIMQQVPHWQRDMRERVKQLNEELALFTITPLFGELEQQYEAIPQVVEYLETVRADIVKNVDSFMDSEKPPLAQALGLVSGTEKAETPFPRYQVNVMVDHSGIQGAAVVFEDQPTYNNLIGRVEHVAQMGALLTDFSLIKPGALHRANGGYLILDARKLLMQPFAWEGLKRALRSQQIRIESIGQMASVVSTVSLEPEPIPVDVKIVLVGERILYYLLYQYDPDFAELFKVAVDFEDQMARTDESNAIYARLISTLARKEGLRHFDPAAVARVIEHSARLTGDSEKLSTHMQSISDLLREANYWASGRESQVVAASDVQQALDSHRYRMGRVQERLQEQILRQTILIDTEGSVVGQINGLAVYSLGNFTFGRPNRITARIRLGKGEVVDIERQVEMGGPIHSKGVLILASFLGSRYSADRPLSLSASLVFEQSYSGVEGDSASSAELYALLSALADVPIKQSFAVTGSVNQRGQIQAIGGVNEKIEGFFDLCKARGLSGDQGVLIPVANVKHLMLREEVVAAAADGKFHIYPVETIDQGIGILTGVEAGQPDEDGEYPEESVNGRVVARLSLLAQKQRAYAAPSSEADEEET